MGVGALVSVGQDLGRSGGERYRSVLGHPVDFTGGGGGICSQRKVVVGLYYR